MDVESIHPRDLKELHVPILQCPNPQINERCSGMFLHTRKWQRECVECMTLKDTLHKHPLLNHLLSKKDICYNEYSIDEWELNNLYPTYGKKRTKIQQRKKEGANAQKISNGEIIININICQA